MTINASISTKFTDDDLRHLVKTYDIVLQLSSKLPDDAVLASPITGEVIEKSDLRRCLGIIAGLHAHEFWDLERAE